MNGFEVLMKLTLTIERSKPALPLSARSCGCFAWASRKPLSCLRFPFAEPVAPDAPAAARRPVVAPAVERALSEPLPQDATTVTDMQRSKRRAPSLTAPIVVRRAGPLASHVGCADVPPTTTMTDLEFAPWQIELHGHRVIYRIAGSGPPVVLIHGMVNSSRHWEAVALRLAADYTVIAPDLIGHGDSATPRGDYSLGAHAASIRDLLAVLGIARATFVGHSLGGGIAMQFFYQFPQRTERLVLVSSGGLGREVSPLLRGAALPGAAALLWLAAHPQVEAGLSHMGERLRARGSGKGVYLQAIARALQPLQRPGARKAFLQTL